MARADLFLDKNNRGAGEARIGSWTPFEEYKVTIFAIKKIVNVSPNRLRVSCEKGSEFPFIKYRFLFQLGNVLVFLLIIYKMIITKYVLSS